MAVNILVKIFEHNLWANQKILDACSTLSDEQLDAEPHSATRGTIRRTLQHLVHSQQHYLELLTLPLEERLQTAALRGGLEESAAQSGKGLLVLARGGPGGLPNSRIQTRDGYYSEPWVVMLQAVNHAAEHREQIKSMLSALGITPPEMDGWQFGEEMNAFVPVSK